jgi:L-tartrate/succinate antiporter
LGIAIAVLPVPAGLDRAAWRFFALFVAVILALVLGPIRPAAAGLTGVFLAAVLGLVAPGPGDSIRWALSGFSNTTVWLIFGAFMFALGYEKTGLGRRIGLHLVKTLGKRTLGLGYAIAFSDLILAPFTPSNTARSCGTIFPIVRSLPGLYDSLPGETARRIGAYLMWTAFAATCITSSMFITSLAPNLLAVEIVNKTTGFRITWSEWFRGFFPVGASLLLALPWLTFKLYPPEIKYAPEVRDWASQQLVIMGRLSRNELVMALLAILALFAWIFGADRIDATTVAGAAICLMVLTRTVTWEDILANKQAWNVLVWFATLVALADGLAKVGFVNWFASRTVTLLAGTSPIATMIVLVVVFFVVHYIFASLTAHTTAVFPVVLAAGAAIPGLPVKVFSLLLCYSLGIMGILTPYATGPAPVYFGCGYISRREFWMLGMFFGTLFLLLLLGIGFPYLLTIRT